jgi:DNA primase
MSLDRLKEQIKESPVSMVIGQYITLHKRGTNVEGLCPFHADTKPSLRVNDNKGMFKCFACGAGGDAIKFVIDFKRVDFVEALKEISGILGLQFDDYQKEKKKNPKVEMAFRVLNASAKLYTKVAIAKPLAYEEFLKKRQLSQESVEKFQISYSPGNSAIYRYLQSIPGAERDQALQVALELGIVRYNQDQDRYYDFYRDRVMFPIHDHSGQVRGYSSRAVHQDQNPKYLNSGESFAFNKAAILFGFYFAKNHIRQLDQAIIVEGNMDVIMMHQFGFSQTVGTMGTALSEGSVRLLSNMTKNIYLGMDSDPAGKKAMERINTDFMRVGLLPKLLNFEPAKDPDEFLLQEGRLELMKRIETAPVLLDILISEIIPEKIPENLELKLTTLHKIFELVSPLKEELTATERIVNAAKILGLKSDSQTILEDYKGVLSRQKEKTSFPVPAPKVYEQEEMFESEASAARVLQLQNKGPTTAPLSKSEKVFLREILCHPEFLTHFNQHDFLAYIGHDEVKKLVQWLAKIYLEIDDAEYVPIVQEELQYGGYSKELMDVGTDALFNYGNRYNEKVIARMLKDYLLMLKKDQITQKRNVLKERQKIAATQSEVDTILSEIQKLSEELNSLNKG